MSYSRPESGQTRTPRSLLTKCKRALDQSPGTIAGIPNVFVSFTALDKLGINPNSPADFDTPIGIYAFPASYVYGTIKHSKDTNILPFAGDQPFANIFSIQGNIINIATISAAEVKSLIQQLDQYLKTFNSQSVKRSLRDAIKSTDDAYVQTPGGKFWYITMCVAQAISDYNGSTMQIAWNKLFRSIGVDGVVDARSKTTGRGIIHENEPIQAVIFSATSIIKMERAMNRYSPETVQNSNMKGETRTSIIRSLNRMTIEQYQLAINILQKHGWYLVKYINDQKLKDAIAHEFPDYQHRGRAQWLKEQINRYRPFNVVNNRLEKLLLADLADPTKPKSIDDIVQYCVNARGRWPEVERMILRGDVRGGWYYTQQVLKKQRWPEFERSTLDNKQFDNIAWYAENILKRRWPEAERVLRDNHKMWERYASSFGIKT